MEEKPTKRTLRSEHSSIEVRELYSVYVSLCWDNEEGEGFDEHIISMREEGGEWSDDSELVRVNEENSYCVVYPLNPETTYEFRMKGKKSDTETKWSETLSVKTKARTVIPEVDEIVRDLKDNVNDEIRCGELLGAIFNLVKMGDDEDEEGEEDEDEEEKEEEGNEDNERRSNYSFHFT